MLLSKEDIEYRIALYDELLAAYMHEEELTAALPLEVPPQFTVEWQAPAVRTGYGEAMQAVYSVCVAQWTSLRGAALRGAQARVAAAERAVDKFERGGEV